LGEFLICLFVPPEHQEDRLGDFSQKFTMVWLKRFSPFWARFIYLFHALKTAGWMVRSAVVGAVVDRVMKIF